VGKNLDENETDVTGEALPLDWKDRYTYLLDATYTVFSGFEELIHKECDEKTSIKIREVIHRALGESVAKRLIKKYDLKTTVEDALKLLVLYSAEVWGFGARQYVKAVLESPKRGVYANLVCRGWELAKKSGKLDLMKQMDCSKGCKIEYESVVHALNPKLKVTMAKAYPWGNDRCEWVIEEADNNSEQSDEQ
jgi:hypothetical protein